MGMKAFKVGAKASPRSMHYAFGVLLRVCLEFNPSYAFNPLIGEHMVLPFYHLFIYWVNIVASMNMIPDVISMHVAQMAPHIYSIHCMLSLWLYGYTY